MFILAAVVVVKAVEQEVEMCGDRLGARGGAHRGLPNQLGRHREAAPEDAMEHRHLLGPCGGCGRGGLHRRGSVRVVPHSLRKPDDQVYLRIW